MPSNYIDNINKDVVIKVIQSLGKNFYTKDVSSHPDMRDYHIGLITHTHYHSFVGKFLKNLKDSNGNLLLIELQKGGARGSLWEKKSIINKSSADSKNDILNSPTESNSVIQVPKFQQITNSKTYNCPYCHIKASSLHGLKKHLSGTREYGGHGLDSEDILESLSSEFGYISSSSRNKDIKIPEVKPDYPFGIFMHDLFESLIRNKDIPKYQFERRIDTILELFLTDYLSQYYNGEAVYILPEFPLKKDNNNQSTNVDYLFFITLKNGDKRWVMLELKTDIDSEDFNQLDLYCLYRNRGMKTIIENLKNIRNASTKKFKYDILLDRINKYPSDCPLDLIYISSFDSVLRNRYPDVNFITFFDLINFVPVKNVEVWNLFRDIIIKNINT